MTEITDWFRSLPVFTRYWFGLSVVFPILGRFRLVSPQYLVLTYDLFVRKFQIWRPVTAVFFYPMGFHYLVNLYFLYTYSIRLETGLFDGHPANYLFMLLFNWICIVIVALLSDLMLLMDPLVLSVLYVWCQLNKDVIVSFWFGTQFKVSESSWPSKKEPTVAPNGHKGFTVSLMYLSFPRWVCQVSYLLHRCHHGAPETAYLCVFCTFLTGLGYQLSHFPPGKWLFLRAKAKLYLQCFR